MAEIKYSIIINRPIDEVFAFVSNIENDKIWWSPVIASEKLTPGAIGVGTEFDQVAKVMIVTVHNHIRVLEYQPPHVARYLNNSAQLPFTMTYQFTPVENGTRYTLTADLNPGGILRLLLPLTVQTLQSQLERYFIKLKAHLESGKPAAS